MSEELKKGIPKAKSTGKTVNFTDEEKRDNGRKLESILKSIGVLEKNELIKNWKKNTEK